VLIDKSAGVTSNAVSNKVRWLFNAKKAGHTGTLDPEATGLLAIALGEATKTIPYVTNSLKEYSFVVNFGKETTTDDAEGTVTKTSELRPTDNEICEKLNYFVGEIEQIPPKFSAVKIDGQRAYKLSRNNIDVVISPKLINIESLELLKRIDENRASFKMICGKGSYVRAISRDLGRALGCYGHTNSLRRLWSGMFNVKDAFKLEELLPLKDTTQISKVLMPLESSLKNLYEIPIKSEDVKKILNGNPCYIDELGNHDDNTVWVSYRRKAIAIGKQLNGKFFPSRVFVNYI
jgi:tRNA pseudouridine55 synthase